MLALYIAAPTTVNFLQFCFVLFLLFCCGSWGYCSLLLGVGVLFVFVLFLFFVVVVCCCFCFFFGGGWYL